MKIIDYDVLTASKNHSLQDCVCRLISAGWQPYGNPYLDRNGVEKQAMVKYEPEQPSPNITSKSQRPNPKKKAAKNED
jgi:hypothetical protein